MFGDVSVFVHVYVHVHVSIVILRSICKYAHGSLRISLHVSEGTSPQTL